MSEHLGGRRTSAIPINGPAVREIRIRSGIGISDMAQALSVSDAYVSKIELGYSRRVSPQVFARIVNTLGIQDQRALRADLASL